MTVYKVKQAPGSPIRTDEQAEKVGRYLERRFGDRPITPGEVVDAARPHRSPLNPFFEWDDAKAAEGYRHDQARQLLRSIIVVEDEREVGPPRRAYHNVAIVTDVGVRRAYFAERVVWSTPEYAEQVVAEAARQLRSWRARYRTYSDQAFVRARVFVDQALDVLDDEELEEG